MQLYSYHTLEVGAILPRKENFEACDQLICNYNGGHLEEENGKSLQRPKRPARMIPPHYLM